MNIEMTSTVRKFGGPDGVKSGKQADYTKGTANGTSCDQVLDWFEKYVQENNIAIGGSLPSEDQIMQETGVSRSSVREAIVRLRAVGVVDIRRRRGMRLQRSPSLLDLLRLLACDFLPHNLIGHVGGFRCALEMGMQTEIFHRATKEDISELRCIFEEMVAQSSEPNKWHYLDRSFHKKLISITENKVAIWLSQLLDPFFESFRAHVSSMSENTRDIHARIVEGLEKRDADAFYKSIWDHNHWKLPYEIYD
jgi:GntR family transcriptional regulator, transcriptional repressor for pyruvate dehydrogenase complex